MPLASVSKFPCTVSAVVIHLTLFLQPLNEVAFFRTERNRENRRREWAAQEDPPSSSQPFASVEFLSSVETSAVSEATVSGKGASVLPIVFAFPLSFVIRINLRHTTPLVVGTVKASSLILLTIYCYRVGLVVWQLGWVDLDLRSSPGWWAATVATYCPSRMVEHPKSKSTQPRYSTTRATMYK